MLKLTRFNIFVYFCLPVALSLSLFLFLSLLFRLSPLFTLPLPLIILWL